MYCSTCGTQNEDEATFCKNCGGAMAEPTPDASRFDPGTSAGHGVPGPPQHVPNYLAQAILVTIFCCLPFGIVSIVYATKVNEKVAAGDFAGARQASANAKTWAWVSFGVGLGFVLLFFGQCGLPFTGSWSF